MLVVVPHPSPRLTRALAAEGLFIDIFQHRRRNVQEINKPILFSIFVSSLGNQMRIGNWNLKQSGREYLRSGGLGLGGPARVLVEDVRDSKMRG
jgi:hypothetical protein